MGVGYDSLIVWLWDNMGIIFGKLLFMWCIEGELVFVWCLCNEIVLVSKIRKNVWKIFIKVLIIILVVE